MGLADWFSTGCSNIQVKDGGTISTRYKNIAVIETDACSLMWYNS